MYEASIYDIQNKINPGNRKKNSLSSKKSRILSEMDDKLRALNVDPNNFNDSLAQVIVDLRQGGNILSEESEIISSNSDFDSITLDFFPSSWDDNDVQVNGDDCKELLKDEEKMTEPCFDSIMPIGFDRDEMALLLSFWDDEESTVDEDDLRFDDILDDIEAYDVDGGSSSQAIEHVNKRWRINLRDLEQ
jgi:hypothetical protein